jgi:thiamine-monophosphate kinase
MGPGQEFDRIRAIASAIGDVLGPIGDDTAPMPSGVGQLVVSTDASVENVHFRRPWLTAEDIGWRATASAMSDLAAAGAVPAGITVAMVVPPEGTEHQIVDVMKGAAAVMRVTGGRVLGGDLSSGPCWVVTVTVFGHAERPITRAGAAAGNGVWATGLLGASRAAVESWRHGVEPADAARLAFARPQPRIAAGRWLAAHGATAMIDLSDGIGGDAGHLAAASQVGVAIALDALPVHPTVLEVAPLLGQAPAVFAGLGGEDYELLVAMPGGWHGADEFAADTGTRITRIGDLVEHPGLWLTLRGEAITLPGYTHRI